MRFSKTDSFQQRKKNSQLGSLSGTVYLFLLSFFQGGLDFSLLVCVKAGNHILGVDASQLSKVAL